MGSSSSKGKKKKVNSIAPDCDAEEGNGGHTRRRSSLLSAEGMQAADRETFLRLNQARLTESRTVRIFVSSTFRDFALERDYMMRHTLPQLRKFGESRGVTVHAVDLRWGLTKQESGGGEVVKLCLKHIDACRPFFVAMLGERYGWHLAPSSRDDLFEKTMDVGAKVYPWVSQYRDRSVTELEILHGALLEPELAKSVTFYFRDHKAFLKNMQEEIPEQDVPAYESENEHAKKSQQHLKKEIKSKFPNRIFEYNDLESLSRKLVEDISKAIEEEYPIDEKLDTWDLIKLQHETFAASRRMGYVQQPEMFAQIDDSVSKAESVAVMGISGIGKSALLANWVQKSAGQHEVFAHYIGCSTESTGYFNIMRRIVAHFGKRFDLDIRSFCADIPLPETLRKLVPGFRSSDVAHMKEDQLLEVFADVLWSVVAHSEKRRTGKIVILLDGLEDLEDTGNAHSLFWMPDIRGVTYVTSMKSTYPNDQEPNSIGAEKSRNVINVLKERNWNSFELSELHEQREKVIVDYLAEHAKKLDEAQISMILEEPSASNPLFLRTLLDEARLFGNFFKLTAHLTELLAAKTNSELFGVVMERMGSECGASLMRWAVGLILFARDGLTDYELQEVLKMKDDEWVDPITKCTRAFRESELIPFRLDDDESVRRAVQLIFSVREQLCSTSGLLRFSHDAAKKAVRREIGGKRMNLEITSSDLLHRRLAGYFAREEDETIDFSRKLRELPFHLERSENFEDLANFLAKPQVMNEMLRDESRKYEYVLLWRKIEDAWAKAERPTGVENFMQDVVAKAKHGIELNLQKVPQNEVGKMRERIAAARLLMDHISSTLVLLSKYDGAVAIRQDEISYATALFGAFHSTISNSCSQLADVYERVYCKYDVSMELKTRALEIDRKLCAEDGEENLQVALGFENIASLHLKKGAFAEAQKMYLKALKIKEKVNGTGHRDVAQTACSIGWLEEELGKLSEAKKWYQRAMEIRMRAFGPGHPAVFRSQIDIGMLLLKQNQPAAALPHVEQGFHGLEAALGNHSDVAASLNNLGLVYSKLSDFDMALKCHIRAKDIQMKCFGDDHPHFAATCCNIGSVSQELAHQAFSKRNLQEEDKFFNESEENYTRAELIYRVKLGGEHPELATALQNHGTLCFDSVNRDASRIRDEIAATEAEEEEADISDLSARIKENLTTSIKLFSEAVKIRAKVFGEDHSLTKSSVESFQVCKDSLTHFKQSGGRDLGVQQTGTVLDDLVERCVESIDVLQPIVSLAFETKLSSSTASISFPSREFTSLLEKVAQDLHVEPFLDTDLVSAFTNDQELQKTCLTASQVARIVQHILKESYT